MKATRGSVYRALIDVEAVARWKVPTEMTCQVHTFDGREGGTFRISLTYDAPDRVGKTTIHADTYHGRFVKLVPDEVVVEVDEFETADAALRGEMTITIMRQGIHQGQLGQGGLGAVEGERAEGGAA